jgi:hypothetical protein
MRSLGAATTLQLGALLTILYVVPEVRGDPPAERADVAQWTADSTLEPQAAADPAAGGELSAIAPSTPRRRRADRLVYACHEGATPVFSDRPCGDDEARRRLQIASPAAGGTASTRRAAAPATTRPIATRPARSVAAEPADRCAPLERQLASIDARMRQGYSAREAARLWQRWRDAKAKLRAARC